MPTEAKVPSESFNPTDKVEDKEVTSTTSAEATTAAKVDAAVAEVSVETADVSDASVPADDDISEFLPQVAKEEPNIGMQKRIDKLTAQKKELEEKLREVEESKPKETEVKKTRYTKEQLKGAMAKAIAEQDHELMMDIQEYMVEQAKDDLRNEYLGEKTQVVRQNEEAVKEWKDVVNLYGHFGTATTEVYPGSKKDLNIQDPKSKLRLLSERLWEDPKYHYFGGRKAAMTDALAIIMQKRTNTSESPESIRLKKQLEREKMKNSPVSGDSEGGGSETSSGGQSKDKLSQYVEERRTLREKADRGV
jgi:hypothetical protein